MAFKMKGSAFKLNDVATKSALKHKGYQYEKQLGEKTVKAYADQGGSYAKDHDTGHATEFDENHNPRKKEADKSPADKE